MAKPEPKKLNTNRIEYKLLFKMTDQKRTSKGLTLENLDNALQVMKKYTFDDDNVPTHPNDDKTHIRRYIILQQILASADRKVLAAFIGLEGWKMLSEWITSWWNRVLYLNEKIQKINDNSPTRLSDEELVKKL